MTQFTLNEKKIITINELLFFANFKRKLNLFKLLKKEKTTQLIMKRM